MALVQEGTLHHAASENMVHTSKAACTPTELDGLQLTVLGGRTLVRPRKLEDDAGHRP